MKRIKIFSLFLAVCLCLSLCGCRRGNEKIVSLATLVYADYTVLENKDELLMVYVPTSIAGNTIDSVSGAVLPTQNAVDKNGNSTKVKAGDLIIMDFKDSIYIRQETNPKGFVENPEKVTVQGENFEIKEQGAGIELAIPFVYIDGASDLLINDELKFFKSESLAENNEKYAYKAIIKEIRNEKAVIFVAGAKVTEVVNCLAFGKVRK